MPDPAPPSPLSPSSTLITKGAQLNSAYLQPGFTLVNDGYNLFTSTCTFIVKQDAIFTDQPFVRGDAHPVERYDFLKLHHFDVSFEAGNNAKVTAQYVGIPSWCNGISKPQMKATNGLSSEAITTHPNFCPSGVIPAYLGGAIAGKPPYTQSDLGPLVTLPPSQWFQDLGFDKVPFIQTKGKSYLGKNGSCFERENGGRFLGFVNPVMQTAGEYGKTFSQDLYGKTHYLAPTTAFAGSVYLENQSDVQKILNRVGVASTTRTWAGKLFSETVGIIPDYVTGTGDGGKFENPNNGYCQLLLSQVNVEDFGTLYKVNYEVRYSADGWNPSVYGDATVYT
jgi:hypothetical protein